MLKFFYKSFFFQHMLSFILDKCLSVERLGHRLDRCLRNSNSLPWLCQTRLHSVGKYRIPDTQPPSKIMQNQSCWFCPFQQIQNYHCTSYQQSRFSMFQRITIQLIMYNFGILTVINGVSLQSFYILYFYLFIFYQQSVFKVVQVKRKN